MTSKDSNPPSEELTSYDLPPLYRRPIIGCLSWALLFLTLLLLILLAIRLVRDYTHGTPNEPTQHFFHRPHPHLP